MPPAFQRPLILLHVQHHYIVTLISRYALVSQFTTLSKDRKATIPDAQEPVIDACTESARLACQMLLRLDAINQFNAVTWLDVYYLYSSCLVLTLSIVCDAVTNDEKAAPAVGDRPLLGQCMGLATSHLKDAAVPGTMRRWLEVVIELNTMVVEFAGGRQQHANKQGDDNAATADKVVMATHGAAYRPFDGAAAAVAQPSPAATHSDDQHGLGCVLWPVDDQGDAVFDVRGYLGVSDVAGALPMHPAVLTGPQAGFDPMFHFDTHAGDSQLWHEMHWDGISDMLLGLENRSASRNRF